MSRSSLLGSLPRTLLMGAAGWLAAGSAGERSERHALRRAGLGGAPRAQRTREAPISALGRGLVAGAVGSWVQALFFKATGPVTPETPSDAFSPPEDAQRHETATETVARRVVECMMQRGPIADKPRGGEIVHYAFGAAWGGVYGLLCESSRALKTPPGALAFGTLVWMVSDNLILPAFRLAAWPRAYPARNHVYAWTAHAVYGLAVWGAYSLPRKATWAPVAAALGARWATRKLPAPVRPRAAKILAAARSRAIEHQLRAA